MILSSRSALSSTAPSSWRPVPRILFGWLRSRGWMLMLEAFGFARRAEGEAVVYFQAAQLSLSWYLK